MNDRELVNRVRDATDLLALVGQAVKLRKQGSAHIGLCPFHAERSPSFQVVPSRGFYHCFGCGKNGDAFTWLMDREGLTFPEALEQLARAAGIELPQRRERPTAEVDLETRLRSALEAAQAFFEGQLGHKEAARSYLKTRGYEGPFLAEAGFGMAPDSWDALVNHLRGLGFSGDLLEQAGLAARSERGTQIDFLRNRLTIPIHDGRGRLVAFGGRIMGEGQPKYLNTRDTPLFHKGETLFGFHRAKGALKDGALVVEGYFDVLQLHQQGIYQAIAPLGTALTEEHLKQIHRFTKRLILCFDGDDAGRRAMEKSLRLALPMGFEVRLLELPQGEDPDTWSLKIGAEAFRELLKAVPDWTAFMIDRALQGKDLRRITDRMTAFRELLDFLPYLPKIPETRSLLSSLAHQLQLPVQEIDRAIRERAHANQMAQRPVEDTPPPPDIEFLQERPLELDDAIRSLILVARSGAWERVQAAPAAWWETLTGAPVLQALLDAEGDPSGLPSEVVAAIRRLEAQASQRDEGNALDPDAILLRLEAGYVDREIQTNNRMLQDPKILADPLLSERLMTQQHELLIRKRGLAQRRRTRNTA